MKAALWRDRVLLLGLALAARLSAAWLLHQPGYTDAYYYAVGARQLSCGHGFEEPFLWNYLDLPANLPHPGYLYWMPLASILGWLGLELLGDSFEAMQAPFVVASALLPLVAYGVAWDLTGKRRHAMLAGLLAVVPGFYTHLLVLPDSFAPFALAGSISLWAAGRGLRDGKPVWFGLAGLMAGLGHLARADGPMLVGVALVAVGFELLPAVREPSASQAARRALPASLALFLGGYAVVMGPWFLRNWQAVGTLLTTAGTRTAFLTTYDDIFAYGRPLTLKTYLAWGWGPILGSKAEALGVNLLRLWVENLLIVLLPFSALGLWTLRRERLLWPFLVYLPLLFVTMTFVFSFPGMRGGLFHSAGALLPFFFAAAGPGLEAVLRWAARRFRGWHVRRAWTVFSAALVAMAALVTVFALWRAGVLDGEWNERNQGYATIGAWLASQGATQAVVMVGDAPAFTWHAGHPAIAVPNEPLETILAVADRYGAQYLVLDSARPRTTDGLYAGQTTHSRLVLRYTTDSGKQTRQVYQILEPERPSTPPAVSPAGRRSSRWKAPMKSCAQINYGPMLRLPCYIPSHSTSSPLSF